MTSVLLELRYNEGDFLGLGTNLSDRHKNLSNAIDLIGKQIGEVIKQSSIHETKAWGKTDQPDFLNMVIQVETTLSPQKLLEKCLSIEDQIGRIRKEKWGPRLIDIDILYYNDLKIEEENLKIPHPFINEREFVLKPLTEIL